jgi:hypothetical protein
MATTPQPDRILYVHLGQTLKAQWVAYCASQGQKPGTLIRQAIENELKSGSPPPKADPAIAAPQKPVMEEIPELAPDEEEGKKIQYRANLAPAEQVALKSMIAAAGCKTLAQWIRKNTARREQTPPRELPETPDEGPKSRIELRLTASERQALTLSAENEGLTAQQWLIGLVRANLAQRPQFGMRELDALGESNYQLLAIGRSLNQIAKRLHEGLPEQVTPADIERLRQEIKKHVERVSKAIRGNLERWIIQ